MRARQRWKALLLTTALLSALSTLVRADSYPALHQMPTGDPLGPSGPASVRDVCQAEARNTKVVRRGTDLPPEQFRWGYFGARPRAMFSTQTGYNGNYYQWNFRRGN